MTSLYFVIISYMYFLSNNSKFKAVVTSKYWGCWTNI